MAKKVNLNIDKNHFKIDEHRNLQTVIKTVNSQQLQGNGNIDVALKSDLDLKADKVDIPDISNLITIVEHEKQMQLMDDKKQDKGDYALKNEIPDISNLATKQELNKKADISQIPAPQLSDDELLRLQALMKNVAFGYNKVTNELEQKGFFTQQVFYNDLDKPTDNLVTDKIGNELEDIRKKEFIHYSGQAFYKDDGKTLGFRYYQDKLTYNNDEIATKKDLINFKYWKKLTITGANSRQINVDGGLKTGIKYLIELTWANNTGGNTTFLTYTHKGQNNNTDIQRFIVSSNNVIGLSNNFNNGFIIKAVIGVENQSGFIFNVWQEV